MSHKTKKQRKAHKQPKKEFTEKTRLFDLVRKEYHQELRQLVEEMRPFLINGEVVDWMTIRRIDVNPHAKSEGKRSHPRTDVIICIGRFLIRIGGNKGLKIKTTTFIQYLCSKEHSNFDMHNNSLSTKIYRTLSYFRKD